MRVAISVGESSGDFLAAHLIETLKALHPQIEVAGMVGPLMKDQGAEAWFDMSEINVMGLQEVLAHLPRLWRLRRTFKQKILEWQPDVFIGVDAPDFNLGLARALKSHGVLTMHYVSPSIWAWRARRANKIARSVDRLLTLFPFEPELYAPYGLDAVFVGHPLADAITQDLMTHDERHTQSSHIPTIALLPGSRYGELERHLPLLLDTVALLSNNQPKLKPILAVANEAHKRWIETRWAKEMAALDIELVANQTRTVLTKSDVALAASGTVTLETFLLGLPQVVFYRLAPATHWLAKHLQLIKTQWISLPNILTGQEQAPEFVQQDATAEHLAKAVLEWLNDDQKQADYRHESQSLRKTLLAQDRAAQAVLARLRP